MKTNYLFPYQWKKPSGILFAISFICLAGMFAFDEAVLGFRSLVFYILDENPLDHLFYEVIQSTIYDELLMPVIIIAGIIYAFSKERQEDEMVASIRLHSLVWSTIINYVIILCCYTFVYDLYFLKVMMVALLSQLLLFIVFFRYRMYLFYTIATA